MVFVILHYQNNSLSRPENTQKNEESKVTEAFQYYSASKAFNESYQREKALKTNAENQSRHQKNESELEMNVSTLEQSVRMEEIMRKEKSQLHEEHAGAGQIDAPAPRPQPSPSPRQEARAGRPDGTKLTVGAVNPLANPFEIYDAASLESSVVVNAMASNGPQSPEGTEKPTNPFDNINAAWGRFKALVVADDVHQ